MKDFIKVMKALSDPNRVKIVKMLTNKELCVCEIRAVLDLAQPTVSKHLRILEEAGLVSSRRDKVYVNYMLTDGSHSEYARTMLDHLRGWLDQDPEIQTIVNVLPGIDRRELCQT